MLSRSHLAVTIVSPTSSYFDQHLRLLFHQLSRGIFRPYTAKFHCNEWTTASFKHALKPILQDPGATPESRLLLASH